MIDQSFFTVACAGVIGALFGLLLAFFGYRLFLILLPIWGFFFGFALGAQTVQYLFNEGFLATITGWVVGFVVGGLFAVLSYLFYVFAVAVIAGSLGYVVTLGIFLNFMDPGFLVWLIGIVVAVAFIFVTFRFNLQKWVIIIATAFMGAAATYGTFLALFYPATQLLENPVAYALSKSPFLVVMFALTVAAGIVVQYVQNKKFSLDSYNNWETE